MMAEEVKPQCTARCRPASTPAGFQTGHIWRIIAGMRRNLDLTALLLVLMAGLLLAPAAQAELELGNASTHELENGLTVVLLEDRNFPVVSVQSIYRVGARNEVTGKTGLAHFVEHMAFRASENFPDTGLVSEIYSRGGEWHGYTWTDETTYFSTAPADDLDLLLRIEADRMARLDIDPDVIEAERGAVLAEMHSYENSPTSLLIDQLLFTVFQAHPYRNNTIGFESDVNSITYADVERFYRDHYHPGNAVLVVVGAFEEAAALKQIEHLFGDFPAKPRSAPPPTKEPEQTGERRVRARGAVDAHQLMIGYPAPGVRNPDFAAFLVLQELLGSGAGINFLHNDWGTPVTDDRLLAGAGAAMTTWFPPSADDYVFVIGGEPREDQSEADLENAIGNRVKRLRDEAVDNAQLENAIGRVGDELVFDVQTTEDAAHQVADFAAMDALDVLLNLPQAVANVSAADVRRVAAAYLKPRYRSIAWYTGVKAEEPASRPDLAIRSSGPGNIATGPVDRQPAQAPAVTASAGSVPIVVQASDLSDTVTIKVVLPLAQSAGLSVIEHDPAHGHASVESTVRSRDVAAELERLRKTIDSAETGVVPDVSLSQDPSTRLEQELRRLMSTGQVPSGTTGALLLSISGNVESATVSALATDRFDGIAVPQLRFTAPDIGVQERVVELGMPVAQAQLGYIVPAPSPRDASFYSTEIARYVLSHGYEGRLGKEAISRRGLLYYIDTRYRSDGSNGWITLAAGVDPGKLDALATLLELELDRLADSPPTDAEIAEAKAHLLGRRVSEAQSNPELAARHARDWLWFGAPQSVDAVRQRLAEVSPEEVRRAARALGAGTTIQVRE